MVHGWMDVGASFQFVVDELAAAEGFEREVVAPDWRGFGLTQWPQGDSYWFPDYAADLDAIVDLVAPDGGRVDLLGHSMGGNVVMSYAGVRSARVRRVTLASCGHMIHFDQPAALARELAAFLA